MDWLGYGNEPRSTFEEALPGTADAVVQTDQPCSIRLKRISPRLSSYKDPLRIKTCAEGSSPEVSRCVY